MQCPVNCLFQFPAVALALVVFGRRMVAGSLLVAVTAIGCAAATAELRTFDLASGPAGTQLLQFSEQSRQQVLFSTDLVQDVETNAVKGELAPRAALERMFAGTALSVAPEDGTGSLQVQRDAAPPVAPVVLPPLSVTSQGTPWRISETPGFVFLSHCTDAVTRGYMLGMTRALLKAREGDSVLLRSPAGDEELEILEVRYDPVD